MPGKTFSRDLIKFGLVMAMAVCLPLTMVGEAGALVFNGETIGNDVGTFADVFGWLFAAAFIATFVLVIVEQDRNARARARAATGRSSH
jgi:hypothetical protein